MANNQQYRTRVYADNGSTIGTLDYQNGVRETRRSVSYIAQPPPTLQINYGHPQVQQQQQQPQQQQQQQQYTAYTGRTSPVPLQPARVPSPATLIYPSQQPYVVYQDERRPSEVAGPFGFFTTTIPRGSTLELSRHAEPAAVDQSGAPREQYFSASNQISGTASASASVTLPKVIAGRS